ncbi:PQQ-binding-like beta-propeller repeat protein [candidate division WOR-3 bacterium]|nr:PQQ-binding-like beta-propeller repeat protein [candidate division WOR-3 bacterium]
MERVLTAAVLLSILSDTSIYAQESARTQAWPIEVDGVRLELSWDRQLGERISNYFVEVDEKGIALLRNVSLLDESTITAHFISRTGEIMRSLELKPTHGGGILQSKTGAYYGAYEITKGLPGDVQEVSFSLYSDDGMLLWSASAVPGLPLRILDNGALVCTENPYGWSHFVLWKQHQILTRFMPSDAEIATGSFDVSANSYMIFNIYDVSQDEQIAQLVLYDGSGNELWRKKLLWKTASTVSFSDSGQFIAARGGLVDTIFVFAFNGTLLWQKHVGVGYLQAFSADGSHLAVSGPSDRIMFFNTVSGDNLWTIWADSSRRFFSLAVSEKGNFVGVVDGGNDREGSTGEICTVFLFNKAGSIIWRKEIEVKKQCTPSVRFAGEEMYFLICNDDRLYCFKIMEERR